MAILVLLNCSPFNSTSAKVGFMRTKGVQRVLPGGILEAIREPDQTVEMEAGSIAVWAWKWN